MTADGNKRIMEPQQEIPVVREVDVVVCGGGPAGFAAAVASARNGARTLLVERYGFLGGNATAALVGPLSLFGDGEKIVARGIALELAHRLGKSGEGRFRKDTNFVFEAESLKYAMDRMALESGAEILLHSFVVRPILDKNTLGGIIVENKSGRQAILAKVVVDATGDGDVAARSGAPHEKGRKGDGAMQPMTLGFNMGGIKDASEKDRREILLRLMEEGKPPFPIRGCDTGYDGSSVRKGVRFMNTVRLTGDATNAFDLTRNEIEGRRQIMETLVPLLKKEIPGFEEAYLLASGSQIGPRETRRIMGEYVLTEEDVLQGRSFGDAIGRGNFPIDIHDPEGRTHKPFTHEHNRFDALGKGVSYQIPYRCLVPRQIENLLVAGRCISGTHEAHGSYRVMVTCMVTGQAAGAAAALSAKGDGPPRELDVKRLQERLVKDEVYL